MSIQIMLTPMRGGGQFDLFNVAKGEYTNLYEPSSRGTSTTLTKDTEVSINVATRPNLNNENVNRGLLIFLMNYPSMRHNGQGVGSLYISVPYNKDKEYSGKVEMAAETTPANKTYAFTYHTKMTDSTTITLYITASGDFDSSSTPSIYSLPNQLSIYTY